MTKDEIYWRLFVIAVMLWCFFVVENVPEPTVEPPPVYRFHIAPPLGAVPEQMLAPQCSITTAASSWTTIQPAVVGKGGAFLGY